MDVPWGEEGFVLHQNRIFSPHNAVGEIATKTISSGQNELRCSNLYK